MEDSRKPRKSNSCNFMRQFRDKNTRELKNLTASQFMEVWSHYDRDGNGFIEGRELDKFLREFVSSVNFSDVEPEQVVDQRTGSAPPLEESFLLLFRFDNPLESSVEFMKIWREYDSDGSGFIEADELKNFLKDLLYEARKETIDEDKLIEYTDTLLRFVKNSC
ncbi:calbindin-32 [Nephila pilipes]|uniref:Calbindin-32 n=1 Tax=Nephila pilipes TaxID=299642 RepID=A0A8X6PQQ2_NEPPI|nr:calbindin-32 [Nephila pilipes]